MCGCAEQSRISRSGRRTGETRSATSGDGACGPHLYILKQHVRGLLRDSCWPSWPWSLQPHEYTRPEAVSISVCMRPHAIDTMSESAAASASGCESAVAVEAVAAASSDEAVASSAACGGGVRGGGDQSSSFGMQTYKVDGRRERICVHKQTQQQTHISATRSSTFAN